MNLFALLLGAIWRVFRARRELLLENLALRQQFAALKRKHPGPRLTIFDKAFWILAHVFWSTGWKRVLIVVTPETVDRLIQEVMSQEPYKSAKRVFWIMDNCSAHRGQKAVDRLRSQSTCSSYTPRSMPAGSINLKSYFSIVQRKVLTPNDFQALNELEQRLLAFQRRYEETASPFQWTFTRKDLATLLAKIEKKRLAPAA